MTAPVLRSDLVMRRALSLTVPAASFTVAVFAGSTHFLYDAVIWRSPARR